jgi:hypothetical protein
MTRDEFHEGGNAFVAGFGGGAVLGSIFGLWGGVAGGLIGGVFCCLSAIRAYRYALDRIQRRPTIEQIKRANERLMHGNTHD